MLDLPARAGPASKVLKDVATPNRDDELLLLIISVVIDPASFRRPPCISTVFYA